MDQYEGENGTHSEFIEGLMSTDMKKTADDLATYFTDCVMPERRMLYELCMRKADHTTRQQLQAGELIQDGHILPSRERALVRTGCIAEVTEALSFLLLSWCR